ncbi:hypothetical protein INT47_005065 [Mucor saturninus]|uniref:F-box domain-containing protein n=1 Tax=Mucor saturninus TaxID=64648 RepID=A0A8H7UTR5_9FUNG|nr:hypothetical protein INT47_005065 [Mucor saturninus]
MPFSLPNEIILLVLLHLNTRDLLNFTSTCHSFQALTGNDLFWRDLVQRKFHIGYCSPNQSWWNLLISGHADQMCHHINYRHVAHLQSNRETLIGGMANALDDITSLDICIEPDCLSSNHLSSCHQHLIFVRLSTVHFIEVYCHACQRQLDQSKSEIYISRRIIQFITQLPFNIQHRRSIEQALFTNGQEKYVYLIEKKWFTTWVQFLIGSPILPTSLNNSSLFYQSNHLRTDLIIGVDYELVGHSIACYIERIYGLEHDLPIKSAQDFITQPIYRSLSQSLLLHRNFTIN